MSLFDYPGLLKTIAGCHRKLGEGDAASSFAPASVQQISSAERRLGCQLPDSYREFLLVSNGAGKLAQAHAGLLPVEQIGWFRDLEPGWVRIWSEESDSDVSEQEHLEKANDPAYLRRAYLAELLQIGESFDGSVYLLNPCVRTSNGEWETWDFANWYPGAYRFASFREMLEDVADGLSRQVFLETVELDEDELLRTAVAELRPRIEDGERPERAAMLYLSAAARNDELIAAWKIRAGTLQKILRALGS
jgi:hypothetical protein